MTVIGSRLKVSPGKKDTVTEHGVAVQVDDRNAVDTGTIAEIGDKVEVGRFKVGDTIRFRKYGYETISINNEDFYFIEVGQDRDDVLEVVNG